jgi:hypothetical protein
MNIFHIFAPVLLAITAQAGDLSKLILPANAFGEGWELTQSKVHESKADLEYINRKLPNSPRILVEIYEFQNPNEARAIWETKLRDPNFSSLIKKVEGDADTYECVPHAETSKEESMMKRFMLRGRFFLTIAQHGNKDDRGIFIDKYAEHIKRNARVQERSATN